MNLCPKLVCCLIVACSMAGICVGQSVESANDTKVNVRFVDTKGQSVTPDAALFFNGGRAKKIATENGVGVAPMGAGIVVAKANGFQFTGRILNGGEAEVVFHRNDEPCKPLTQTPYPLNDQLKTKVIDVLKKCLGEKLADQPASSRNSVQTIRVLAAVDPHQALKWLEENDLPNQMSGIIQQPALTALLRVDAEEAFDRCSQIEDPARRSSMLFFFLNALESEDPALKTVEAQLLESTREIKQPALRLAMRSALAEHYSVTGRIQLADKIVQQHIEEVKKLPSAGWSAYPRSLFAALVVDKDPQLAEELIKGNRDQNESNGCLLYTSPSPRD